MMRRRLRIMWFLSMYTNVIFKSKRNKNNRFIASWSDVISLDLDFLVVEILPHFIQQQVSIPLWQSCYFIDDQVFFLIHLKIKF